MVQAQRKEEAGERVREREREPQKVKVMWWEQDLTRRWGGATSPGVRAPPQGGKRFQKKRCPADTLSLAQ